MKKKEPLINILDICDELSNINKELIHSFIYDSKFNIKNFNFDSKKINDMNYNFTNSLFIFLRNKNFDIGLRKTFDYNFMVSMFYIMFQLLSVDINDIDLVKIYNNLNYLL